MAHRVTRKQLLKTDEVAEAAADAGHWFEEHWRMVAVGAGVVVVIVAAVLGWMWLAERNLAKARALVDQGIEAYDQSEATGFSDTEALNRALESFDRAAKRAGSEAPGGVASLYQGLTLYRLGRTEEAISRLEPWADRLDEDPILAGTAASILAQAWSETGETDRAAALLEQVATKAVAGLPPDQALLQLARIYESTGDRERAHQTLQRILDEYPQSAAARDAQKLLGP